MADRPATATGTTGTGATATATARGAAATTGTAGGPEPSLPRVIAALFVAGLAFRAPILVAGPLLPEIQADLAIPHGVAGLLSTIPVLCMALLAPFGPVVGRSLGPRTAIAVCIGAVAGFGVLRAIAPGAPLVILLTVGVGLGMGVVGPILAMAVHGSAPRHATVATGSYAMGYIVGASVATAVAVPLAIALGGWRGAFAAVSVASFGSLAGWWLLAPPEGHVRVAPRRPALPWRRPAGWLIGLVFGLQSTIFYGAVAWLPSIYIERGWTPADAGTLAAFYTGLGILTTLAVPIVAARLPSRRAQLSISAALSVIGSVGLAAGPHGTDAAAVAIAYASVLLLGFGIGILFPVCLTLPVDIGRTPAEVSALSALMLLSGYLLAAAAPVLLGAMRDATGNFTAAAWLLVAAGVLMLGVCLSLSGRRLHPPDRRSA